MDTYRAPAAWSLVSEHRVSSAWRAAFAFAAIVCGGLTALVAFATNQPENDAPAAVFILGLLGLFTVFFAFVAARGSVGRAAIYREGVQLTDLLGRTKTVAWDDVRSITRLSRRGGLSGQRLVGWVVGHAAGEMTVPGMYAGFGDALSRAAAERRIRIRDEVR